jgi:hypothetical protein
MHSCFGAFSLICGLETEQSLKADHAGSVVTPSTTNHSTQHANFYLGMVSVVSALPLLRDVTCLRIIKLRKAPQKRILVLTLILMVTYGWVSVSSCRKEGVMKRSSFRPMPFLGSPPSFRNHRPCSHSLTEKRTSIF